MCGHKNSEEEKEDMVWTEGCAGRPLRHRRERLYKLVWVQESIQPRFGLGCRCF